MASKFVTFAQVSQKTWRLCHNLVTKRPFTKYSGQSWALQFQPFVSSQRILTAKIYTSGSTSRYFHLGAATYTPGPTPGSSHGSNPDSSPTSSSGSSPGSHPSSPSSARFGLSQGLHTDMQKRFISFEKDAILNEIKESLRNIPSSPLPALVLGFSGLIPFAFPPSYMLLGGGFVPQLLYAQTMYAAAILSFLGGVRWGFVIVDGSKIGPDWFNMVYGISPSIVAWISMMFPEPFSTVSIILGLAGTAYFDTAQVGYPSWFKGMRFVLSIAAILLLWSGIMCKYIVPEKKKKPLRGEPRV